MVRNNKLSIFLMFLMCTEFAYASKTVSKNSAKVTPVNSYTNVAVKSKQITTVQADNSAVFYEYSEQQAGYFTPNRSKAVFSNAESDTLKSSASHQETVLTKDSLRMNNQMQVVQKNKSALDVPGVTLDDVLAVKVKAKPNMQDRVSALAVTKNKVAPESPDSLTLTDDIQISDKLDLQSNNLELGMQNAVSHIQVQQPKLDMKNKNTQDNGALREKIASKVEPIDEEIIEEPNQETSVEKSVAKVSFLQGLHDFFKRKENVNAINRNGRTPLQQAISDHDLAEVKRLIQAGANLSIQDADGNGLLHQAVRIANSNRKFLQSKLNSMHVDDIQANLDIVKTVLEKIKSPNSVDIHILNQKNKLGQTPLHVAIENVNELAVKALIAAGADLNITDNQGRTPVMTAVSSELPAYRGGSKNPSQEVLANIIKQLIEARADLTIPNKNGRTVRDEATYQINQYQRLTPEIGNDIYNALSSSSTKKIVSLKPAVPKRPMPMPTTAPIYKPLSEIQKNSSKTVAIY